MQAAWRPQGPASSAAHSSTSARTREHEHRRGTDPPIVESHSKIGSPVHPSGPWVNPTGQEQLPPTFTRPGGQPQAELSPRAAWFPGHRGARLELGETVLGEAAGVENGFN